MDKTKKRVKAHAKKHGLSYQAAWNQLEGAPGSSAAYEFWDWVVSREVREASLTIGDIKKMSKGQTTRVLLLHRNLCDHVYRGDPEPTQAAPQMFQRWCEEYTHDNELRGVITWDGTEVPLKWEIEWKLDHWFPLRNGSFPTIAENDELAAYAGDPALPEGKHWTEFPDTTRVGWRGPAVSWDSVGSLPRVYTRMSAAFLAAEALRKTIGGAFPHLNPSSRFYVSPEKTKTSHALEFTLVVHDLTEDERLELEERLTGIQVVDRAAHLFERGAGGRVNAALLLFGKGWDELADKKDELRSEFVNAVRDTFRWSPRDFAARFVRQYEWPEGFAPVTVDEVWPETENQVLEDSGDSS